MNRIAEATGPKSTTLILPLSHRAPLDLSFALSLTAIGTAFPKFHLYLNPN
ncbi:MAG TPA: hypothetical protein VGG62_04085 [Terracidiphilus sp.]|jgi:hypothetical protein